ncbi:MAG: GNAT family N-acetyltransferase [Planctomycetota bacterium]
MPSYKVEEASSGSRFEEFLRFPWSIYGNDPNWVPPLLTQVRECFDSDKHPFHKHGKVKPFVCRDSDTGKVMARACGIVNGTHLKVHQDGYGFFGFFESFDNEQACQALMDSVLLWLSDQGCKGVYGPTSFTTNDECAVFIGGETGPPVFLMPYNPPYYDRLLQNCGMSKAKDLLAWMVDDSGGIPERLSVARRLAQRREAICRPISFKHIEREKELMFEIYNSAWEKNWGFVPMTREEFEYAGKHMKMIVDPDLVLILEVKGEPAGFSLTIPDLNIALKHLNGRLFPFGFIKLLWHRRKIHRIRVTAMGLLKEYRNLGLDALLYLETFERGIRKGYTEAELSWILEDNNEMNTALAKLGARPYRRYRIYERKL